jgi:hypothetical protein
MNWFLLGVLFYIFTGAILITLSMRGMKVTASVREWLTILLLWPLMLQLFAHLAIIQSMVRNFETAAEKLEDMPE